MKNQRLIHSVFVPLSGIVLISGLSFVSAESQARDWGTDPIFTPKRYCETYYDSTERDKVLKHLDHCIHQNNTNIVRLRASITGLETENTLKKLSMYKLYQERDVLQENLKEALPQYLSLKNLEATLSDSKAPLEALKDLIQSAQESPLDQEIRDFITRYLDTEKEHRHALLQDLSELANKEGDKKKQTLLKNIRNAIQFPTSAENNNKNITEQSFEDLRIISKNHRESLDKILAAVENLILENDTQAKSVQSRLNEIVATKSDTNFKQIDALTCQIRELQRQLRHNLDQANAMKSEISRLEKNNSELVPQKANAPKPIKKKRWVKSYESIFP